MRRVPVIIGAALVLAGVLAFFVRLFREVPSPVSAISGSGQGPGSAAVGRKAIQNPRAPLAEGDREVHRDSKPLLSRAATATGVQPEDEAPTQPVDIFDSALSDLVERFQNEDRMPDAEAIVAVKRAFDALSPEEREEEVMSLLMLDDDYLAVLEAVVLDPSEPQPVLEALVDDLANRDAARPILEKVAAQPSHPARAAARECLDE